MKAHTTAENAARIFNQDGNKNNPSPAKKAFVKPEIRRHESLPDVTTAFVGTYQP